MSKLVGIAIKTKKRGPMITMDSAQVTKAQGVEIDFRGKPGKRQVTLLSNEAWLQVCSDLNKDIDWLSRRANLLVDSIDLRESTGKVIKIGDVNLLITGETDPCSRMSEVMPGLFESLLKNWRGGVCCKVISEGKISITDEVELIEKSK